jgi:hypothetical protein
MRGLIENAMGRAAGRYRRQAMPLRDIMLNAEDFPEKIRGKGRKDMNFGLTS